MKYVLIIMAWPYASEMECERAKAEYDGLAHVMQYECRAIEGTGPAPVTAPPPPRKPT